MATHHGPLPNDETRAVVEQLKHGVAIERTFDLSHCDSNRSGLLLRAIRHLTAGTIWDGAEIEKLDVSCSAVDDDAFGEALTLCPAATKIEVLGCRELTEAGLAGVGPHCKRLEELFAQDCLAVSPAALSSIATNCPSLRQLCIAQCGSLTNSALISLATSAKCLE